MAVFPGRPAADHDEESRRTVRRTAAAAVVLGLVTLASGLAWAASVSHDAADLAERTLGTRAAAVQDAAQAEIERYSNALRLVAAGLASVEQINAADLATVAGPLDSMDLAGATSVVFVAAPVDDAGLEELQSTWRARGSTGLVLDPVEAADTHIFGVLSKSLDGSDRGPSGADVLGAPAPYEALMESRRSGEVSFSRPYQLLIDQGLPEAERQTSFVVTAPVVRQGRFLGWMLMGLRGQDFLGGVLGQAAEGRVDVGLVADDTAGTGFLVASSVDGAVAGGGSTADRLRRTIVVSAAQQTWSLDITADVPSLIGSIRHRPLAIRILSVIVASLVAGLWWSVSSARARARAEVLAATRDLAVAEERARAQAAMLHTMVETIDEIGVIVVDADGRVLVHSRAARLMLGLDEEGTSPVDGRPDGMGEVDGPDQSQDPHGVFSLDGWPFPEDQMPLARALAGESTDDVEVLIRNQRRPEGVQVAVSGRPLVLDQGRTGALAVFRDVTQERRRQSEQAAFSGMVAHDLKSPLTVVRGLLELAEDDLGRLSGPPDSVRTVAGFIQRSSAATARMVDLIDDLLELTTADHTRLQPDEVDLGGLVHDILAEVVAGHVAKREAAGHPPQPPLVHVGALPTVTCDEARMRQVLGNLIGNALNYVAPDTRPVVDVTAEVDDEGVRIFVADRGIGIPEALRAEVVKPFVRTPTTSADRVNYPGTGLGLAICHRIVERHGGRLWLRPNPGGGTVAVVEIPSPTPTSELAPVSEQHDRRPTVPASHLT